MAETYYLWSRYQNGGETDEVRTPNGGTRNVIVSRNVLPAGEKVTQDKLGLDDANWEALIEGGVVRTYPFPDDIPAGSTDSPIVHLQRKINEAATSEEERLVGMVTGVTSNDAQLVEEAAAAQKEEAKK